jgi:uncharacterized protein RhaS with RHS repeats
MQQRYYEPLAGRFLSVDPVVTNANTGAMFNRYDYAMNNPYRYVDPDGRTCTGSNIKMGCDGGGVVGHASGVSEGAANPVESKTVGGTGVKSESVVAQASIGNPGAPSPPKSLEVAILKGDVEKVKMLVEAGIELPGAALQRLAQQRGALLVKELKGGGVGAGSRSGQHGTPHSQAGAELIREGNRMGGQIGESLKAAGLRLIEKGKGINH